MKQSMTVQQIMAWTIVGLTILATVAFVVWAILYEILRHGLLGAIPLMIVALNLWALAVLSKS